MNTDYSPDAGFTMMIMEILLGWEILKMAAAFKKHGGQTGS